MARLLHKRNLYLLKSGINAHVVKIDFTVSKSFIAKTLRNHFYCLNQPFDEKITKSNVEAILRKHIPMYGRQGCIETTDYESSSEEGARLNRLYEQSLLWVSKHYPLVE